MKHKWLWLLSGLLVIAGIGACSRVVSLPAVEVATTPFASESMGDAAALTPVTEAASTPTPSLVGTPISRAQGTPDAVVVASPTIPVPLDVVRQDSVVQAREDLADRLSIGVEQITLEKVEAVEWPDASLGCPEPGKVYAQVVTPGYRIVLEAQGGSYEYHADLEQRVICCEPQQVRSVPVIGSTETVELARADLAQRLGVALETISVAAVLRQEFSADAFYCRTTKARVARDESPAVVVGTVILLEAAGRRYEYHASDAIVIFCR